MKCQTFFLGKIRKKKKIDLSSADFAQIVVKVNTPIGAI